MSLRAVALIPTFAVAVGLGSSAAAWGEAGENPHKVTFAVVTGEFAGIDDSDAWLARGVTFDMEKRLGRLFNLEAAERLAVAAAVRSVPGTDEKARVAAVLERVRPDLVLYASGRLADGRVEAAVRVWRDAQSPTTSINSSAPLDDLLSLTDDLTNKTIAYLQSIGVDVGEAHPASILHVRPARSVAVYKLVIRGMLSLQEGHTAEARPDLVKALEAEPDNWWGHYFLGAVEFHEGHFDKSAQRCRSAIALNPDLYEGVYANLAYCCQGLGDADGARRAADEFEKRTGHPLPLRALPGSAFPMGSLQSR